MFKIENIRRNIGFHNNFCQILNNILIFCHTIDILSTRSYVQLYFFSFNIYMGIEYNPIYGIVKSMTLKAWYNS